MGKTAFIFPGLGYHSDKPLLYHAKKLAAQAGYRLIEIRYGGFPYGVKGDPEKMRQVFESALQQTEDLLADEYPEWADTDKKRSGTQEDSGQAGEDEDVLILSKSVGTAVAAAWQQKHGIRAKNIYFTPVEETFAFIKRESGIAFHGTGDSWAETPAIKLLCEKNGLPLYVSEGADHSMETGDVLKDLDTLQRIMEICSKYIE